jgi:hypothetical protein
VIHLCPKPRPPARPAPPPEPEHIQLRTPEIMRGLFDAIDSANRKRLDEQERLERDALRRAEERRQHQLEAARKFERDSASPPGGPAE